MYYQVFPDLGMNEENDISPSNQVIFFCLDFRHFRHLGSDPLVIGTIR